MTDAKPDKITSVVSSLVEDCQSYRDLLAVERDKAVEYSDGVMKDVVESVGRSKVVSRDVRSNIKKVLPSMIRTILGNDKVAEYQPVEEQDEAGAEQATDYINNVVFPESNGYDAVQDAINDALRLRNGIIRWWYDKKVSVSVSRHTGLDEMAMVQLVADESVTVLEQEQTVEMMDGPQGPMPSTIYNLKIRRRATAGRTRLGAVPPEEFLIHPDALDIEESPIVGIQTKLRRSDLVAMGYDRDKIESIPCSGSKDDLDDEESTRRRDLDEGDKTQAKAMQELEYFELYVRVDEDDDGIAELRRMVYAGDIKSEYLLENEEWDDVPFADIISERRPHQREGTSISDDMMEIQKIKTVLLRQTLDNLYWQNMPQPVVQEGTISNPDSVTNPSFGKPIRVNEGTDVRTAVTFTQIPFMAQASFGMMEYMDREATDRTGISDASSGLAPDALQNMTAKASAMIEQAGIGQTELMAKTIATGLKKVFLGLLKLIIKHQDKPRTVRLRGEWVTFDPRSWNAAMDVTVNTGLGAGTRERDMMMMQFVVNLQKELLASLGAVNNPYVSPENLYNGIAKLVEAAGLSGPTQFFTKPDEAKIQQMMQAEQNKPNPEMEKIKAQSQADIEKAKMDFELEKMKLQAETAMNERKLTSEAELKRYQIDQEMNLKRQQNAIQVLSYERPSPVHIGGQPG